MSEDDFTKYSGGDSLYYFDETAAADACDFLSALRYVDDGVFTKAGDLFELLPWQVWVTIHVFGWRWRDTDRRRYRRAFLLVARGNGKSTFCAGLSLYSLFCENIQGGQGCCAASNKDQARLVLDVARRMAQQDKQLREMLELKVFADEIKQPTSGSRLWALPAKASSAEGLALNVGVLDEVHVARGRALFDSLASSCSKRSDSLFLMATTAGDDEAGVCVEILSFLERVLAGTAEDPSFFCALYTIDPDDIVNWDSDTVWQKANPSLGFTVDPRSLAEECARGRQIPGSKANFLMKHLNVFVQGGTTSPLLNHADIKRCYEPALEVESFLGTPCAMAADLASRLDLCSAVRVHTRRIKGAIHYYVFVRNWLPEARRTATPAYAQWEVDGELLFTEGPTTDLDVVEAYIAWQLDKYAVRDISFDPVQASQMMGHFEKKRKGLTLDVPQHAKNMTIGINELEAAVASGRLHTNSKVLIWALGNLRCKTIGSSLKQPVRPEDQLKKIDPAVALIMALRSTSMKPLDEARRPRVLLLGQSGPITEAGTGKNVEAISKEPPHAGFTQVRMRSTGDIKWLPPASASFLVQEGAAEPV